MPETIYEIVLGLGFALMTAAAIIALLRPLMRPSASMPQGEAHLAFYRDQLDEIERDLSRGILAPEEAHSARNEIARRLLAAEERSVSGGARNPALRRQVALSIMLALPLLVLGLYLAEGSPELRSMPFEARLEGPLDKLPLEALVYRVSQRLKQNPNDVEGWEVIAPNYSELGRYRDAAHAWRRVIELGGPTATRLANLGEANVNEDDGEIDETARQIFLEAEKLDPTEPRTQYYLGLAEVQDGKRAEAAARWKKLLAAAPADAPWRKGIEAMLAQMDKTDTAKSVASLPADQQQEMIEGMVSSLALRLEKNPNDIEGWLRLVKSYGVLKKQKEAEAALRRAREAFAADKNALARLDIAEKELK